MDDKKNRPESVDDYIEMFPIDVQERLRRVRKAIKDTAPDAKETISYNMPAYMLNGPLVYFAAFKNHIGLYPTPSGMVQFKEELSRYKQGRGSVQFPMTEPLPLDLIRKIVQSRVVENQSKIRQ